MMKMKMKLGLFAAACALAVLTSQAMAQTTKTKAKSNTKVAKTAAKEKVTFDIRGSECANCAKVLTTELAKHGVKTKVSASKNKPYRVVAEIDPMTDLAACGKAVMAAKTPHHAKVAPELDLVLFAKLDKAMAKKANDSLAKVKGIDAKHSMADMKKGEISVRLAGGDKVTADTIHKALADAGVTTTFTKTAKTQKNS